MEVTVLAVGLPLSILLSWGLAAWWFRGMGMWLAPARRRDADPTDAALGVPVVTNPVMPPGIRMLWAAPGLLSVVAHGWSAGPLARRYGQDAAAAGPEAGGPVPLTPLRTMRGHATADQR